MSLNPFKRRRFHTSDAGLANGPEETTVAPSPEPSTGGASVPVPTPQSMDPISQTDPTTSTDADAPGTSMQNLQPSPSPNARATTLKRSRSQAEGKAGATLKTALNALKKCTKLIPTIASIADPLVEALELFSVRIPDIMYAGMLTISRHPGSCPAPQGLSGAGAEPHTHSRYSQPILPELKVGAGIRLRKARG
jgi:hypothetical protein